MDLTYIARNLADVRARIQKAAQDAGRAAADVRLLAVSKTFGLDHVRAAAAAGQEDFGENRVQEALQKIEGSADLKIRWHLIGTLQSNKVRKAVPRFSAIHSVDSRRLLDAIDAAATDAGTAPELLVQVDLAGETTKHGAPPAEAMDIVRAAARCQAARCVGLMTIPPLLRTPGGCAAVLRPAQGPSHYTTEGRSRSGAAPGVVDGYESRFRNRRAGRSHDCSARHGHLREAPCLIQPTSANLRWVRRSFSEGGVSIEPCHLPLETAA